MADAVRTIVQISEGGKYYVANFTNISDGTGEAAVKKVDISTLKNSLGAVPTKLKVVDIAWVIQGFTSVRLLWDHTTDDVIALLAGSGRRDHSKVSGLQDPASAGGDGSLLLTTNGGASGATYDITVVLEPM